MDPKSIAVVMILTIIAAVPAIAAPVSSEVEISPLSPHIANMIGAVASIYVGKDYPVDGTAYLSLSMAGKISNIGPTRTFQPPSDWDLMYSGTHCDVYVASGEYVSQTSIEDLAVLFDDTIYPGSTDWFHSEDPPSKIDFKIYDFGDGPNGVGGYFIRSPSTRNELYVDSQDVSVADEVVAHEFEHLLHYDLDSNEDVWLDEGLADLSVRVTLGPDTPALQSHVTAFEQYPDNDLLEWDEGVAPYYYETIADYGRAYAFISYLADHYGGKELIRAITKDPGNSLTSIDDVLGSMGSGFDAVDINRMEIGADLFDGSDFGGGIFDNGLIDISVSTLEDEADSYPYSVSGTIYSRYAGYYRRFTSASGDLSVVQNSSSAVHSLIVGTEGGEIVWSGNLTSQGREEVLNVGGFGTDYSVLYVITSSTARGSRYDLSVEKVIDEPPVTKMEIDPLLPDGDNDFYVTAPKITLSADESADIHYRWDAGDFAVYDNVQTAPEGIHRLEFYSEFPSGPAEEVRFIEIKTDTISPETNISVDPEEPDGENGYYVTAPFISLRSSEADSEILYDLGEGRNQYQDPILLGEGDHVIEYWSVDRAGNVGEKNTARFSVVLNPPDPTIRLSPSEPDGEYGFYVSNVTVEIQCGPSTDIFYSLGGSVVDYNGPFSLSDGIHELEYWGVNPSGYECSHRTRTIRIDTVAPEVTSRSDPELPEGWSGEISYLYLDTGDPDAVIRYSMNGETYQYTNPVLLNDGDYTVEYWAEDAAGNIKNGSPIKVRIDTTVPRTVIEFDRAPENGIWFYDTIPGISFSSRNRVVSSETVYYTLGENFSRYGGEIVDLKPGLNTIRYYSVDDAGNREDVREKSVGMDYSPPEPILDANRTLTPGPGPVRFEMGGTDDNGISGFNISFGDGSWSGWILDDSVVHHYTSLGEYEARLRVRDAAGRESESESVLTIEILTPEEYRERTRSDTNWMPIIGGMTALLLLAIIGVLLYVIIRRRAEVEWEEWDV